MGPPPRRGEALLVAPRRLLASMVARPRLDGALDQIPRGGMGLVVAPAGSGKSVLVGQWARSRGPRAGQLQLTSAHDDPVVFARDLTSAITSVAPRLDPRVTDAVTAGGSNLGTAFVSTLLVALEDLDDDLILVLDDLHRMANAAICRDLDQLIERLPDNVRLVVSTRWDPLLRLQPLRLASRLVEIRVGDLAFDPDEARALIEAVSGHSLSTTQTEALVARTDGWAAGLQLAAISLQRFADVDAFVDVFTGSDKLVADYLAEEVIDDLEPAVRRFLLHTSVLESLDVDVCDAVTGDANAAEMLDLLTRRSLFLVHPDRNGARLRYHHLFADLLRDRLRATEAAEEPRLRRRAASFLLARGQVADAIEQLLAAGDGAEVLRVIGEHGQAFFEREENLTMARWLTTARATTADVPVALDINLLAAQLAGHDTGAAVETYRRLRRRPDLDAGTTAASAALYACLGLNDLPAVEVHRAADEATEVLRGSEVATDFLGIGGRDSVAFLAAAMKAMAWLHDGELDRSALAFETALCLPAGQYRLWKIFALGGRSLALAMDGRSTEARAVATTAISFAETAGIAHHHALAYSHFALARVSLDQTDRNAATYHLHESERRVQRSGRAALRNLQQVLRIEHLAAGTGPRQTLDALRSEPRMPSGPTLFVELGHAQELHLLASSDQLGQARALMATVHESPRLLPAVIEVELASGDVGAARRALDRSDLAPGPRATVERLVGTAAVLGAEGEARHADAALREALDWAEPELLRQPFLAQPTAMQILRRHASHSRTFARSILEASTDTTRHDAHDQLVEPLTEREREVLDYLPTRLSNTEIAAHLYVSVNTLKSHLRHIYIKLAVANRDEAVARATDLGLL